MKEKIIKLYEVFAKYRKPSKIDACDHCLSESDKKPLLNQKLNEISADELSEYAASVFLTVGSEKDFKYFTPRIIELCITDQFDWPDIEIVFQKFRLADWGNWNIEEKQAINDVLAQKYLNVISAESVDEFELDGLVFAMCLVSENVEYFLDMLLEPAHSHAFKSFLNHNLSAITKNKLGNSFWKDNVSTYSKPIFRWLKRDEVTAYLFSEYGMVVKSGDN